MLSVGAAAFFGGGGFCVVAGAGMYPTMIHCREQQADLFARLEKMFNKSMPKTFEVRPAPGLVSKVKADNGGHFDIKNAAANEQAEGRIPILSEADGKDNMLHSATVEVAAAYMEVDDAATAPAPAIIVEEDKDSAAPPRQPSRAARVRARKAQRNQRSQMSFPSLHIHQAAGDTAAAATSGPASGGDGAGSGMSDRASNELRSMMSMLTEAQKNKLRANMVRGRRDT